ncbi:Crp/Fnr family transcriptional regulator [Caldilinea sp.]|uniref:Crp/Fnr family transcriptional regulator n=1 Tax=Caldilinea sp. TaxID=2293560 RepID=UPI00262595EA|nr:Crp/Fnr family transcriptional regulator [Caldilinea sp.]
MNAARTEAIELWRQAGFLQSAPLEAVRALAEVATPHSYLRNEVIFLEGEPTAGLFLVESGIVKICRYSKEGREHILHFMQRGDTFNDVSAMDGGTNPATAVAHTDVRLWRITREDLRAIVLNQPALAWAMIENLAHRARRLVNQVQDLAMRNVRSRLAKLLLEQARAVERGESPPPLTQEEMAHYLGTVREVVGRTLRAFIVEGLIEMQRQQIVIVDRKRLEEEAEI